MKDIKKSVYVSVRLYGLSDHEVQGLKKMFSSFGNKVFKAFDLDHIWIAEEKRRSVKE